MIIVFYIFWGETIYDKIKWYNENVLNGTSPLVSKSQVSNSFPDFKLKRKKCELNSYFVGLFVSEIKKSGNYRFRVATLFSKLFHLEQSSKLRLRITMHYPSRHIFDYKWSDILNHLSHEKCELDSAMAWLSTLGGAFSSLGDHLDSCAVMAGKISVQQFKLALRLGEPHTIARCRLFYSISLIQRGHLKMARNLVRKVYYDAVTQYTTDKRLQRMCLGIWTKLHYEWNKKYKRKFKNEKIMKLV